MSDMQQPEQPTTGLDGEQKIQRLSPDKLMSDFSQSRVTRYVLIAVVAHVVLIALTSIPELRTMIAGPPAPAETASTDGEDADDQGDQQPAATQPTTGQAVAEGGPASTQDRTDAWEAEQETADPNDIPESPSLGIGVDETNPE